MFKNIDLEDLFFGTLLTLILALILSGVIWVVCMTFVSHNNGVYIQTDITSFNSVYKVKMDRKFGEDRTMLVTEDIEKAQKFYFLIKGEQ